jgi:hypothetical protein|tara:strand:- start:1480 stop:1980 length:501 start_codon:yes stop_codon:yes gene_type:complete
MADICLQEHLSTGTGDHGMTLPVPPDAATILQNSIVTLRDVLLPLTKDDEYARFNGGLLVGALEYALASLEEDRAANHRTGLAAALEELRSTLLQADNAELIAMLDLASPFEAASNLLVWGQNNPGELANAMQKVLRAELNSQLDTELGASVPIMGAFMAGMRGDV